MFISYQAVCLIIVTLVTALPVTSSRNKPGSLAANRNDTADVMFGLAAQYNKIGKNPSVSIACSDYVIAVHEFEGRIFYSIGKINTLVVQWNSTNQLVGLGHRPQIAANQMGHVILVVQQWENDKENQSNHHNLVFYKGKINRTNGKLLFDGPRNFALGQNPAIALSDSGHVIALYEWDYQLYYRIGNINSADLGFGPSLVLGNGVHGKVSVNKQGLPVVLCNIQNESLPAHYVIYRVGKIRNGTNISWSSPEPFGQGISPSVSINNQQSVVVVYQSSKHSKILSRSGLLDPVTLKVQWGKGRASDSGNAPSVSTSNELAIQVHHSSTGMTGLWYSISLITDRAHWMQNSPEIQDKALWQITLPATHDSGGYHLSDNRAELCGGDAPEWIPGEITKIYAETQNEDFLQQLNDGIRFFDLRVFYWKQSKIKRMANSSNTSSSAVRYQSNGTNDFHVFHDNIGERVSVILDQLLEFLNTSRRELVIMTLSHFCPKNFDPFVGPQLHANLTNMIKLKLHGYLYKKPWNQNLLKTKLNEYLENGSKVLVIYEDPYVHYLGNGSGFWPALPRFDQYSNTEECDQMKADQLNKLMMNQGSSKQLFLLSWTLTWLHSIFDTLHDLSQRANRQLAQFILDYGFNYRINFLYVDYYNDARVCDLAILLNRQWNPFNRSANN